MYDTDADDGRTADNYPLEASPSTDTFVVAKLNHAPDAYRADEYHRPSGERDFFADLAVGVAWTVIGTASPDAVRCEVAL